MKGFATRTTLWIFLIALCTTSVAWAQSGKLAGRITDAATGDPLPGVNVLLAGTTQGTITDIDGYYVILNVKPGTVTVQASFIGFTTQNVEGVRVFIDQTTTVDFVLQESTVGLEEVVITASRPVVQRDVSNSQLNVGSDEIEALPVASVSSVVGLQAGIQGLSVRGGGSDELSFMVNGLTLRDERNNSPFTAISLSAVEEVQVQTGGFNAEYGNVRSGVINVVTKEGSPNRFSTAVTLRYSPPAQKHFGSNANDRNSFWIRPFIDPEVAWTGTRNGAWDQSTQNQYPDFEGWIAISESFLKDDDPTNDITPEALQEAFLWQHRKDFEISNPDYTMDIGVGGPFPFSEKLGNARFYASYRGQQEMYMIPLHTDRWEQQSAQIKITSDIRPGVKLSIEGMLANVDATASSRSGQPGEFFSASGIASQMSRVSFIDTRIFSTDYWAPTNIKRNLIGATLTHALSASSFYEVRLSRFASKYDTNPGRLRSTDPVVFFGGVGFDEAPFGFQPEPTFGVDGMRTGVGMSNARDTSEVVVYNLKADFTNQVNRFMQVKTGFEYNLTDSRINYGNFDAFLKGGNSQSVWDELPVRASVYGQSKLEFQGMVANLGLRLDYADASTDWIEFDAFTNAFSARFAGGLDTLLTTQATEAQITLSPRLGVSFPVTATSKLFFNYGHFRSMPDPNNLYLIRAFSETGQISRVANPNNPLPKTIAYELGYEQSLVDQFLIRVAGYYKDVSLQPFLVGYTSRDGQTDYSISEPNSFEDIRGFEVTLSKNGGQWFQGFINYTYMVATSGYFGFRSNNENPTVQREFENSDSERRRASSRPVPRPYARMNLIFTSPDDFGPTVGRQYLLGAWQMSLIGSWQQGSKFTWTGGGSIPGVLNNVQFRDFWNFDLRLSKSFEVPNGRVQFFADIDNVFNVRRLSFNGFFNGTDQNAYMLSLHLPESPDYPNIPGRDQPGDFRKPGVEFQPMSGIQSRSVFNSSNTPDPNIIYYEFDSESYIEFGNGTWQQVDGNRLDEILDDKAYIDMPNQSFLTFLNPRDIYFGIRFSF